MRAVFPFAYADGQPLYTIAGGADDVVGSARIRIEPEVKTFGKKLGTALKLGLLGAGAAVAAFGKSSFTAFEEAEKSQEKLNFAFEKFPKLADINKSEIEKLASSLQLKTKFDDEAIKSGAATLAQFGATGKQLKGLIPLVVDFAARTGRDVPQAASLVGRALLGNARALKQIGIVFKPTGDKAKDLAKIMELLASRVGGFAEKEGKTASGQLAILKNQFQDVKETIGAALAPALIGLVKSLKPIFPVLGKLVAGVVTAIAPVISVLADAFAQLTPILIPVIKIIGTALAGAFKSLLPALVPIINILGSALGQVLTALAPVMGQLAQSIAEILVQITPLLPALVQLAVLAAQLAAAGLVPLLSAVAAFVKVIGPAGIAVIAFALSFGKIMQLVKTVQVFAGLTKEIGLFGTVAAKFPNALGMFSKVGTTLTGIPSAIGGVVTSLGSMIASFATTAASAIASAATTAASWIASGVSAVASFIATAAAAVASAAATAAAWLLAAAPFIALGLVVAGVVILIIKNWDTIKSATIAVWHAITGAVTGAVRAVINFVKSNWPILISIILGPLGIIIALVVKNFNTIKNAISTALRFVLNIAKTIWGAITGAFRTASGVLSGIVSRIAGVLRSLAGPFEAIKRFASGAWDAVTGAFRRAYATIAGVVGRIKRAFCNLPFVPCSPIPMVVGAQASAKAIRSLTGQIRTAGRAAGSFGDLGFAGVPTLQPSAGSRFSSAPMTSERRVNIEQLNVNQVTEDPRTTAEAVAQRLGRNVIQ